jgi:hypothetical protein
MGQFTRRKRRPKCGTDRDYSWLSVDRNRKDWRTAWCKPGIRAAQRVRRVGMTQAEFDAMLREQDGRCGICDTRFDTGTAQDLAAVPRIDRGAMAALQDRAEHVSGRRRPTPFSHGIPCPIGLTN